MNTEFSEILKNVRALLKVYEPPLVAKKDTEKGYELWTTKEVSIGGRTYPDLFFAAATVQKNFVGFYYFPLYCNPELKAKLHRDLIKNLKGKTCFHLKKDEKDLYKHIESALKIAFTFYKKQKWV